MLPNPALGELPRIHPYPARPEQSAFAIAQDNTYIRAIAVRIDHLYNLKQRSQSTINTRQIVLIRVK